MTWDEVANRHGTDKARHLHDGTAGHGYMEDYESALSTPMRSGGALLELGVDNGASLRTWCELFDGAPIVGVDLYDREREVGRAVVCIGDASDQRFCEQVARAHGPFAVVIDDASHDPVQVVSSFRALFGHLISGGVYAIEDLYWPEALVMLPHLAHQRIARVTLVPDAVSAERNILGPLLILIEAQ